MSCLCGHFEWCDECRYKPDTPEQIAAYNAMTSAQRRAMWSFSMPIEIEEPDTSLSKACAESFRRTVELDAIAALTKKVDE